MKHQHSNLQKQNAKNMRNNPTQSEKILWEYIKNSQLNGLKFRRQQPIGKYIADFVCCSEKIIIELDGGQHNDDNNIKYDKKRDYYLKNEGYRIIRIWNNDVLNNIEGVVEYLRLNTHPLTPSPQGRGNINYLLTPTSHKTILNRLVRQSPQGRGSIIKIQCPAKVNLTLKVVGKRPDGFHNIESIMQTIDLYDYLTIEKSPAEKFEIVLSGNSQEIPYNEKNLVYKAAKLFFDTVKQKYSPLRGEEEFVGELANLTNSGEGENYKISIYIEKNIPVAAGLAGGSTDAAGTLFGLNEIFTNPLNKKELHELCAKLGSDLNVCLEGGRLMTKGRGEIVEPMEFEEFNLSLIKPKDLGISAKEAYTKFSEKNNKCHSEPACKQILRFAKNDVRGEESHKTKEYFLNDLEWAIIEDYKELQKIKELYPNSMMSGSGSTYFEIGGEFEPLDGYEIYNNHKTIDKGVCVVKDLLL